MKINPNQSVISWWCQTADKCPLHVVVDPFDWFYTFTNRVYKRCCCCYCWWWCWWYYPECLTPEMQQIYICYLILSDDTRIMYTTNPNRAVLIPHSNVYVYAFLWLGISINMTRLNWNWFLCKEGCNIIGLLCVYIWMDFYFW